jgi:hypothetical protein
VEPIGMVIGTMLFLSIPALFVMLYSSATVVF